MLWAYDRGHVGASDHGVALRHTRRYAAGPVVLAPSCSQHRSVVRHRQHWGCPATWRSFSPFLVVLRSGDDSQFGPPGGADFGYEWSVAEGGEAGLSDRGGRRWWLWPVVWVAQALVRRGG